MKSRIFGSSALGLPLIAHQFQNGGPEILILGGVHGDEYEGVVAARGIVKELSESFTYKLNVTVIPEFNIEGVILKTRMNSRGVDLNRNLPTQDWSPVAATPRYNPGPEPLSEPENKALAKYIIEVKPRFILSLHSWNPMINVNGPCAEEAKVLAEWTGYTIEADMGYPTPGSLGTYAGKEKGIPTITYEIQRDIPMDEVLRKHVKPTLEMLKVCEVKYAP